MTAPSNLNRSNLDQTQIMQRAFDESKDRVRVDADISIASATVVVETDYTTDSMAIGDPVTNNILKIEADGSIDANVVVDAYGPTPDSILMVGTTDATPTGTKYVPKVNSSGVQSSFTMNTIVPVEFDSIYPSYPSSTQEVYVYKKSAATVATVTIDYVDATKDQIISIVRT